MNKLILLTGCILLVGCSSADVDDVVVTNSGTIFIHAPFPDYAMYAHERSLNEPLLCEYTSSLSQHPETFHVDVWPDRPGCKEIVTIHRSSSSEYSDSSSYISSEPDCGFKWNPPICKLDGKIIPCDTSSSESSEWTTQRFSGAPNGIKCILNGFSGLFCEPIPSSSSSR